MTNDQQFNHNMNITNSCHVVGVTRDMCQMSSNCWTQIRCTYSMLLLMYMSIHMCCKIPATPLCNQSLCYLIIDQSTGLKVEENSAYLYKVCSSHAHNNVLRLLVI